MGPSSALICGERPHAQKGEQASEQESRRDEAPWPAPSRLVSHLWGSPGASENIRGTERGFRAA